MGGNERDRAETDVRRDRQREAGAQPAAPVDAPWHWLSADAAADGRGAAAFRASLPASAIVSLQRSAGNAAVNRYLQRRRRGLTPPAAANPSPMTDDAAVGAGAEVAAAEHATEAQPGIVAQLAEAPAMAAADAGAGDGSNGDDGNGDTAGSGGDPRTRASSRGARADGPRRGLAATEALALDQDDLTYIQQVLEEEEEGGEQETPSNPDLDGSASEPAPPAGSPPPGEASAQTAIIHDGGQALTGIVADGTGSSDGAPSLSDFGPGALEGAAQAGVVTEEFSESAFKSLKALGFIDIGAGSVFPPQATLEIEGIPPKDSGFKKQWKLLPTTTKDHSFKASAAPAGVYDTGMTVSVTVGSQTVELKKLVEVTGDVAAKCKAFEQEHVDDTTAAFQLSFKEAADAVNRFADAPGGENPIYFRGENEAQVTGYVESRLTDYHGKRKLGGKQEDWVAAYKRLLGLTITERDGKGTHSWGLAPSPKVDRAAGTVTYQLTPPGTNAGPSWEVVSWDKV